MIRKKEKKGHSLLCYNSCGYDCCHYSFCFGARDVAYLIRIEKIFSCHLSLCYWVIIGWRALLLFHAIWFGVFPSGFWWYCGYLIDLYDDQGR